MRLDARLRNLFRRSEPVVPPAEKLRSMVCRSEHFDTAWYRSGAEAIAAGGADLERFGPDFAATFATTWEAMRFGPKGPVYRHRKMWEWAAITQALGERGKLRPGSRGCGFAVGFEPLPSLFAARGAEVLATDWVVEEATDWNVSGQQATTASHLRWPNLIDEASFDARVTFRSVDMRNLDGLAPGSFDFVWSSCSLEHLGNLEAGLRFIEQSAALLKPGGVAVHTTEFNVSSKTATIESGPAVIYRESDLLTLPDRLAARGVTLEPFDFDVGTDAADLEPDAPPYYAGRRQHVKLRYGDHVMTSILLVATKEMSSPAGGDSLPTPETEGISGEEETSSVEVTMVSASIDELTQRSCQVQEPKILSTFYIPTNVFEGSGKEPYMAHSYPVASDFYHPTFASFLHRFNGHPFQMHRKLWEFAFIEHHLQKEGMLASGKRGLSFGVAMEPLPALFAAQGARITATDAPAEIIGEQWVDSKEFAPNVAELNFRGMIEEEAFMRLVSYETCDMNHIPDHLRDFDFCWSACCLEHLGSLRHGLDFIINSLDTLKPGGVAVHTTELNLSSNDATVETGPTVIYRRRDLEAFVAEVEALGHTISPLSISPLATPVDHHVDVPPYSHNPHLKLLLMEYVSTSVGIVIRKAV